MKRPETLILPAKAGFDDALACLARGEVVAVPTETVYGLAADAANGAAVARIYEAKARPTFNPLIVHVASRAMALAVARFSPLADRLADAFWPGGLTLVLPLAEGAPVHSLALAGLETVAVRMPRGPMADLADALGRPLVAPSANPSGKITATRAEDVAAGLSGRIPLVLNAGPTELGLESTIVSVDGETVTLLRPGAVPVEAIETLIAPQTIHRPASDAGIVAPGMLASHYAPEAMMRLNAVAPDVGESYLGFGVHGGKGALRTLNLSATGDLSEAARNLFTMLRMLDASGAPIAVAPIPHHGLGLAINDRLARAAAPREESA